MPKVRLKISMSLDGFVAGPSQSVADPLGNGGMRLHQWAFPLAAWRSMHGLAGGEVNDSTRVVEESLATIGATGTWRVVGITTVLESPLPMLGGWTSSLVLCWKCPTTRNGCCRGAQATSAT